MAWTATQIAELEEAIATGAQSVSLSGPTGSRTVNFRSKDEMLALLDRMKADTGAATRKRKLHVVGFR